MWEMIEQIPLPTQVIVSLIFLPLLFLSISKMEDYDGRERNAFNTYCYADSHADSADHLADKIEMEIFHLKRDIEINMPQEAKRLADHRETVRNDAIYAYNQGWISLEEVNRRIHEIDVKGFALDDKYLAAKKKLLQLEAELPIETAKAEQAAKQIKSDGERAYNEHLRLKSSMENWVYVCIFSSIILFFFCTPFRWLIILILAVCTLGAILKLFK